MVGQEHKRSSRAEEEAKAKGKGGGDVEGGGGKDGDKRMQEKEEGVKAKASKRVTRLFLHWSFCNQVVVVLSFAMRLHICSKRIPMQVSVRIKSAQ